MVGNQIKLNEDDVNCNKMIDRQFKQLQDARNKATERPLKKQLWRSNMSQSLPTILLHTQKYVLFLHKKSTYF